MLKKLFKLFVIILALALLVAAYLSISLPLTFEVDGKTYVTVVTTGRKAIKMPKDPLKEGYVFDGWYWDKDVWEQPFTNALSDTPIRKSATVYAKWKKEAEEHVHSYGEWTVETAATCTEEGAEKRVCDVCGEEETRVIEKLPHNFGEWTVETAATCTAEGLVKRVCGVCATVETRVIENLPHTYEVQHDETNHWKKCAVCHEEIDKAAHNFGEWTVETPAACSAEGTEKRVCGVCATEETRVTEKLPHTYEVQHDETNHWKECSVCHEEVDKTAHTYENDICTVCGNEYVTIGLEYRTVSGGYEVAGIGTVKESRIVIPSTYEGEPVIGVGRRAFISCYSLVSVVIPSGVTSIGDYAFNRCSSLVSIKIPSSVASIGVNAFYGCGSLTKVEISDIAAWCGIEFVGRSSNPLETAKHLYINGKEVTELEIPEGVTRIGNEAFRDCSSLVSVVIPNSVTSVGTHAFLNCSSLVSVVIGNGVTSIGSYAFNGCSSLETITVAEGNTTYHSAGNCLIETETKTLIVGCNNSIIPTDGSVTSIGSDAFVGRSSLVSVVIPSGVTSIGSSAFSGCSSLVSIVYDGTKAEWEAIAKGSYWNNSTGNYTVTCTDGTLTK